MNDARKIPDAIKNALEETGLPYQAVIGHGHFKIFLSGHLVGVTGRGGKRGAVRATRNVIAQIRRACREIRNV